MVLSFSKMGKQLAVCSRPQLQIRDFLDIKLMFRGIAEQIIQRQELQFPFTPELRVRNSISPSMRRPIPVKSFVCSFHDFSHFFRSAKPPLSPPFHPHS